MRLGRLFVLVVVLLLTGASAAIAKLPTGAVLVEATGIPEQDARNLGSALSSATPGQVVWLSGSFDLSSCSFCLVIRNHITVEGLPEAELVGGLAPMMILLPPSPDDEGASRGASRRGSKGSDRLTIRGLRFRDQTLLAIGMLTTSGRIDIRDNEFLDIRPFVPLLTDVPPPIVVPPLPSFEELVRELGPALDEPGDLPAALRALLTEPAENGRTLAIDRPGVLIPLVVQAMAVDHPDLADAIVRVLSNRLDLVLAFARAIQTNSDFVRAVLRAVGLEPDELVWRFAIGAYDGSLALDPPLRIEGEVFIERNRIDFLSGGVGFQQGDDNGIAFSTTALKRIVVRDNFVATTGEGIEIQGNVGPSDSHYEISGNTVITDTFRSALGRITKGPAGSVGAAFRGGHPGAIKMISSTGSFKIFKNRISVFGSEDLQIGACIVAGTLHPAALRGVRVNAIAQNDCDVQGQLAAIVGASTNMIGFFDASSLSGTRIEGNRIRGYARYGFAFIDRIVEAPTFVFEPNSTTGTRIVGNDLRDFMASEASVAFGAATSRNVFEGPAPDGWIDEGSDNHVAASPLPRSGAYEK